MTTTTTTTSSSTETGQPNVVNTPKKRKKLTAQEIAARDEEKRKKEEEKKRKDEEKEAEKKKKEEEKKKKEEDKKKRDEEKEEEKRKKEEDKKKKDEDKRKKDEEREEERKKKEEEKRKKDEEREEERKKKEEERLKREADRKRKKEEEEAEAAEAERKKLEQESKQAKMTMFFSTITPDVDRRKVHSEAFLQKPELPPHTVLFVFERRDIDIAAFERSVASQATGAAKDVKSHFSGAKKKRASSNKLRSLPGAIINSDLLAQLSRMKLLKFHDNLRPSYYGTFSRKTLRINGRRPFAKDEEVFDYSYDSGDDWEENDDKEGDNIVSDEEAESEDDPSDDENNWIISDNELSGSDHEDRMDLDIDAPAPKPRKRRRANPIKEKKMIIIYPHNCTSDTYGPDSYQSELLQTFTVVPLYGDFPINLSKLAPVANDVNVEETSTKTKDESKRVFPSIALPTLLNNLATAFFSHYPNIMKKVIIEKIRECCTFNTPAGSGWLVKDEFEKDLHLALDSSYPVPICYTIHTFNL
eukprot:gene7316-8516_t